MSTSNNAPSIPASEIISGPSDGLLHVTINNAIISINPAVIKEVSHFGFNSNIVMVNLFFIIQFIVKYS